MENLLLKISIMLVPALFAITCHEVSHGFVADRLGDNTARYMGRLSLNPLKHLDIIGTIMVFIVGIGWAKPVPVNFNNLRKPKRDMILIAAAGPTTNFILALISAMALRGMAAVEAGSFSLALKPILLMLAFSVYINLLLGIFNLIPVPPLDGGRVLTGLLPHRQAAAFSRIEPYGMIIIILLVFFTDLFSYVLRPVMNFGVLLLAGPESEFIFKVMGFLMR